ncbi:MAG: thioesterase family protein [Polyangiaceae bacterium]
MFTYECPVRFEDVDAARIVFFPRFFHYAHEAMEAFFDRLPGGYHGLVLGRNVGLPAVHVEADFKSPLRYGDRVVVNVDVEAVGTTSLTLRFDMIRKHDGVLAATLRHVVVSTDLREMRKMPFPDDVRALVTASPEA